MAATVPAGLFAGGDLLKSRAGKLMCMLVGEEECLVAVLGMIVVAVPPP